MIYIYTILTREIHVLELWTELYDDFWCYLSSSEKSLIKSNLYDAGALLYQLSYQANWELVIMWVDVSPEMMSIDP